MFTITRAETPALRKQAAAFVDAHHSYIKWVDRPSRKMYWLLYERGIHVGVFGLGSAFARPKPVAEYMIANYCLFNEVANNIVFALFGCEDKNAGSRFLALLRRDACLWWAERYGDELKAFQTFVLPPRTGAVYKADNWKQLGTTTSGKAMSVRTLNAVDGAANSKAERRVFGNGEVRYLLRTFVDTEPKLIFMRLANPSRKLTIKDLL